MGNIKSQKTTRSGGTYTTTTTYKDGSKTTTKSDTKPSSSTGSKYDSGGSSSSRAPSNAPLDVITQYDYEKLSDSAKKRAWKQHSPNSTRIASPRSGSSSNRAPINAPPGVSQSEYNQLNTSGKNKVWKAYEAVTPVRSTVNKLYEEAKDIYEDVKESGVPLTGAGVALTTISGSTRRKESKPIAPQEPTLPNSVGEANIDSFTVPSKAPTPVSQSYYDSLSTSKKMEEWEKSSNSKDPADWALASGERYTTQGEFVVDTVTKKKYLQEDFNKYVEDYNEYITNYRSYEKKIEERQERRERLEGIEIAPIGGGLIEFGAGLAYAGLVGGARKVERWIDTGLTSAFEKISGVPQSEIEAIPGVGGEIARGITSAGVEGTKWLTKVGPILMGSQLLGGAFRPSPEGENFFTFKTKQLAEGAYETYQFAKEEPGQFIGGFVGATAGSYGASKLGLKGPIESKIERTLKRKKFQKEYKKWFNKELNKLSPKMQEEFKRLQKVLPKDVQPKVKSINFNKVRSLTPEAAKVLDDWIKKNKKQVIVGGSVSQRTQIYGKSLKRLKLPGDVDMYVYKGLTPDEAMRSFINALDDAGVKGYYIKRGALYGPQGKAVEFHKVYPSRPGETALEPTLRTVAPASKELPSLLSKTPEGIQVTRVEYQLYRKLYGGFEPGRKGEPAYRYSKDLPTVGPTGESLVKTKILQAESSINPFKRLKTGIFKEQLNLLKSRRGSYRPTYFTSNLSLTPSLTAKSVSSGVFGVVGKSYPSYQVSKVRSSYFIKTPSPKKYKAPPAYKTSDNFYKPSKQMSKDLKYPTSPLFKKSKVSYSGYPSKPKTTISYPSFRPSKGLVESGYPSLTKSSTGKGGTPIIKGPKLKQVELPKLGQPSREEKKRKAKQAYDVLVRESRPKGRKKPEWVKLNKVRLPKKSAFNLGAEYVDRTTAATFRLVQKGTTKLKDAKEKDRSYKFRPKVRKSKIVKNPVYIEKNKYRIDTFTEKQGITAKGLMTIKNRYKIKQPKISRIKI